MEARRKSLLIESYQVSRVLERTSKLREQTMSWRDGPPADDIPATGSFTTHGITSQTVSLGAVKAKHDVSSRATTRPWLSSDSGMLLIKSPFSSSASHISVPAHRRPQPQSRCRQAPSSSSSSSSLLLRSANRSTSTSSSLSCVSISMSETTPDQPLMTQKPTLAFFLLAARSISKLARF